MAAYIARDGFTGAARIFEGPQGMGAGMSTDADPSRLVDGLGGAGVLVPREQVIDLLVGNQSALADQIQEVGHGNGCRH